MIAGLLNAIEAPHHFKKHDEWNYREGVVTDIPSKEGKGSWVDIGLYNVICLSDFYVSKQNWNRLLNFCLLFCFDRKSKWIGSWRQACEWQLKSMKHRMVNWRVWLSVQTRLELKRVPTGAIRLDTPALSGKYSTVLFGWLLLMFIIFISLE